MKNQLKGLFKVVFMLALCLGATLIVRAMGGSNEGMQIAAVGFTVVSLPPLNQTAEKELIKKFRHENTWLGALKSKQSWVDNDVIKIPRRGVAPTVLINNSIYPIVSAGRTDDHIIMGLNKYETTNTTVTAAELYALPYEKVSDVQEQHREELEDKTGQHALHSIAPNATSATTPVLICTGPVVGSRKTLLSKDVSRLKLALDKLLVPKDGRMLVLCADHVADLLDEDKTFTTQYHNATAGVLSKNFYGFTLYESTYNPTYTGGNTKVAFGAVDGPQVASIAMHDKTCFKATGTVKRYARAAENDPENRRHTIGFELYFLGIAIRNEGVAAIIG